MERLPTPAGQQADIPDASPAPACTATATISEQGIVTGWSEGARELLGYTPPQIVGHPAARLLADGTGEQARRETAGRERFSGQVALLHRDGHRLLRNLLAHRRTPQGPQPAEWLVVSAVTAASASPRTPDSQALREWVFSQSPCILAVFDTDLRLVTANTGMESALLLPEEQMRGLRLPEITPGPASEEAETKMRRALETGQTQHMQAYLHPTGVSAQRGWSTTLAPLKDPGGTVRAVCLAAHHRQQEHLARQRMLLLNDAGARIGTTSDIQRTVQELADVAVPRLADFAAVDLLDVPRRGGEPARLPATGPITMHRTALHTTPDNHTSHTSHTSHDGDDGDGGDTHPATPPAAGEKILYPAQSPVAQCLAQGHGALYEADDPALTRWAANDPTAAWTRRQGTHSVMVVPLRAHGTTLGVALFARSHRPEPFEADDLWLAEELTAQTAVHLHNAHRHAREHTTTMTLQRSLLPQKLPDQGALDIATRYLPAGSKAGVGGDWFDVIPLSGARVALVVGDVVGHGIRASATMGRVRTAVRTLADVDLPPDELLTYLDDLVIHLAADEGGGAEGTTETAAGIGTTCLYAVYDPTTRHCTIARAGHPPPAVVTPDGNVRFLNVPAGPPLGLGGLPFETLETQLPEAASSPSTPTDSSKPATTTSTKASTKCSTPSPAPPTTSTPSATESSPPCSPTAPTTTSPSSSPAPAPSTPTKSPPSTSPPTPPSSPKHANTPPPNSPPGTSPTPPSPPNSSSANSSPTPSATATHPSNSASSTTTTPSPPKSPTPATPPPTCAAPAPTTKEDAASSSSANSPNAGAPATPPPAKPSGPNKPSPPTNTEFRFRWV
ncbi:hypothetical protein SAVERM_112 [Streptomyces avermitilis MA-4680 = NBRC 14893]|uniref:PAS domain-containing protein n=1 Tax=Streptomyces avermitilis (strain ATCC 31267 / DSM 46492 / JCM 5070 / NBRC 14893 / NCIMB 12804 / NRRL 8165 / MA-4680) TaxID=227882 RepID=Q82RN1_STRAW|nr:hypothetical protein SAVERM_112 [Streptomyces avermitilis MA-4680 = NBRC 14893]